MARPICCLLRESLSKNSPPSFRRQDHISSDGVESSPNSPFRKEITMKPEMKGFRFADEGEDGGCGKRRRRKNYTWSKMLAREFKIDVLKCSCGGELRPIAAVTDQDSVRRYLKHMNIEYDPTPRGPPRETLRMSSTSTTAIKRHWHNKDY